MTKQELINDLSALTKLDKEKSRVAVEGIIQVLSEQFKKGESITLRGFGTFKVDTLTNRTGRDIRKGTTISLPDSRKVKFVPCKELKEAFKL